MELNMNNRNEETTLNDQPINIVHTNVDDIPQQPPQKHLH